MRSIPLASALVLFGLCLIGSSSAQGYYGGGSDNDVGPAQPSNSGNQRGSFDSSDVPSYEEPQYADHKCAAEYSTQNPELVQSSSLLPDDGGPSTTGPAVNPKSRLLEIMTTLPSDPEQASTAKDEPTAGTTKGTTSEPEMGTTKVATSEPETGTTKGTTSAPEIDVRVQTPPKPAETTPEPAIAEPESAPSGSNQLKSDPPSSQSTDALIQLISELNRKLKDLEQTQRALNQNVENLQDQLQNFSQILPVKKEEATSDLVAGQPAQALQKWKELDSVIESEPDLGNITNSIVSDALDQRAPPPAVMDFVHQIPNKNVQVSAYNAVADKMAGSEGLQEGMGWKGMTPYCRNAAMDTGRNSPTTMKMLNLQNQMRLNGARPVAQGSKYIQQKQFQPAANQWNGLVQDIPENPNQLETNMKKMMIRTYDNNLFNLPSAFQFILVLPEEQGQFKRVAYNCLLQEMKANGHVYDPSSNGRNLGPAQQQRPQLQQQQRPQLQQQQQRPQGQQRFQPPPQQQQPSQEVYRYY